MRTLPSIMGKTARRALANAHTPVLLGAVALLGACSSEPDSHLVSAPPPSTAVVATAPSTVTSQTTTTTANGQVVTTQTQPAGTVVYQAMPAPQSEVMSPQPGPDYAWVPGHWTYRETGYIWITGHWEYPPHGSATWVGPRCEPENGAYRFYEGYWE